MPTLVQILQSDQTNTEEIVSALKKALKEESSIFFDNKKGTGNDISFSALNNLLKALEDNQTVKQLLLWNTLPDETIDSLMAVLQKNHHLTNLNLQCNSNPNVITHVAHLLENNQSSLKELTLNMRSPNAGPNTKILAVALEKNNTLECLTIDSSEIDNECAKILASAITKHPRLARLNITFSKIKTISTALLIEALKINQTITHFSYAHNGMDSKIISFFASLLKEQTGMTELDLNQSFVRCKGAKNLANALKGNTKLKCLNLDMNGIEQEGMEALASVLEENSTLEKLNLAWNEGYQATAALAKALRQNQTLEHLNLYRTNVDIEILSEALSYNRGLTELDLGDNNVNDTILKTLTTALQKKQNLTCLGLKYNKIEDRDVPALIELLNNAPNLTKLNLSDNDILSYGIQLLAAFLENNQSLTSLDLGYNPIDILGIQALSKSLKMNSTLTELVLKFDFNSETQVVESYLTELYKAFDELLKVNQTLTGLKIDPSKSLDPPYLAAYQEPYDNIKQAIKRNQVLATTRIIDQIQIGLRPHKLWEMIPILKIILDYAGPPSRIIRHCDPPTREATEAAHPVLNTMASLPSEVPKPPSTLSKLKQALHTVWDKLCILIYNAWNTLKNKFKFTSNTTHAADNHLNKPLSPPNQIEQAAMLPQKERMGSQTTGLITKLETSSASDRRVKKHY